ncbi:hypothetical protein 1 [Wenzhou picorna-like virus 53]|uniref:hypothetical protein 1 n=1 Tax=Wenzhou picorna-like virus 53 TaxID=1923641 RepID=UPI00090A2701|nr:hypothetical protein 1 [Wenzhou picorna-like virus 53]APG78578.1 hypothetical protein 1 [Wenzhou picorna-like virus 53]
MKITRTVIDTFNPQSQPTARLHDPKVRGGILLQPQVGRLLDTIGNLATEIGGVTEQIRRTKDFISKVRQAMKVDDDDDMIEALISRLETLMLLVVDLAKRETLNDMIIPVMLFLKTWIPNRSLALRVGQWVTTLLSEHDAEIVNSGLNGQNGWFSKNWTVLTEGYFGQKLAGVLNMLIMSGFLPKKAEGAFTTELYNALNLQLRRKQHSSIFHHVFATLDYVIDAMIPALSTGNLALLLYDSDQNEIDEMYRNCCKLINYNITGQMEKAKDEFGINDESELMVYLVKVTSAHQSLKQKSKGDAALQKEIQNRLIRLDKFQVDLQSHWHEKGLRVEPYAVLIRGPSSVGKSVVTNIIRHTVCKANGFPEGPEFSCNLNGDDEYQSEFGTNHVCVTFDDVGNTKPERCTHNPLFVLIQFINNVHCSALSPIAEKKGKTDIRCKLVLVTTNTRSLNASYFSVNPASIMRRFNLVVDVSLKEGAAGPDGSMSKKFLGQTHPNAWDLKLSHVRLQRNQTDMFADTWHLDTFTTTDVVGLVLHLAEETPQYYEEQKSVVDASDQLHKRDHCLLHPMFPVPCAHCQSLHSDDDDLSTNAFFEAETTDLVTGIPPLGDAAEVLSGSDEESVAPELEGQAGGPDWLDRSELLDEARWYEHTGGESVRSGMTGSENPTWAQSIGQTTRNGIGAVDAFLRNWWEPLEENDALDVPDEIEITPMTALQRIKYNLAGHMNQVEYFIRKKKDEFQHERWLKILGTIAAMGAAAFMLQRTFMPRPLTGEGAVFTRIEAAARTPSQFVEKDDKYQRIYSNRIRGSKASVSTTLQQLEEKIDRNLHVVFIQEWDPQSNEVIGPIKWGNAIPVGGIRWMLVGHFFERGKMYEVNFRSHPNVGVKRFSVIVADVNSYRVPNSDALIVEVPRGGSNTDFSKYMLDNTEEIKIDKNAPLLIYHVHKSQVDEKCVEFQPPSAYKCASRFEGIAYTNVNHVGHYDLVRYKADNHDGMCGSMVFLAGRNPILIGMHNSGLSATRECGAVLLSKAMLPPIGESIHVSDENIEPIRVLGVDVPVSGDVHEFSAIHYLDNPHTNVEVLGQHQLPQSKFRSDVIPSPLLPYLKDELGYEETHFAPRRSAEKHSRHRHLTNSTKPLPNVNPNYLHAAICDFKEKLSPFLTNQDVQKFVHPLDYNTAINGVVGVRGFDSINPLTSMGFPLNKPKWKHFVGCALRDEMGLDTTKFVARKEVNGKIVYEYEIIFDPEKADVKLETENLLEWFHEGRRVNVVFRANLKDEPVSFEKIEKNKIRVFAGAPVALVIATRMMTLPLITLMTYFPDVFESAVGVDATGKDWEEIYNMVTKFGDSRCGDGDFSSFDTSIRPEFSIGAFDIIRYCLKCCGYTQEMLKVFDGIATECAFPIYESSGLLFQAFGSVPSGHPLTVVINGLCNCLYMRYAYYAMHESNFGQIPLFHTMVALMTYGDDQFFGVSEKEMLFNMVSVCEQLEKIGIKYTDGSKNSVTVPFKKAETIAFLKRTFLMHPQLKHRVGALAKESIFKSLALSRRPKRGQAESLAEIAAGNLNGALCELYYHGVEEYDKHLPIFEKIARVAVDSEGHAVRDYFTPITVQEIVTRFQQTFSAYPCAKQVLNGQSGVVDGDFVLPTGEQHHRPMVFGDKEITEIRDWVVYLSVERQTQFSNRLWAYDWLIEELSEARQMFMEDFEGRPNTCPIVADYVIGTVNTVADVNFRFYCVWDAPLSCGGIWSADYRMDAAFQHELEDAVVVRYTHFWIRKRVAECISYLYEHQDGNFLCSMMDLAIVYKFRRLRRVAHIPTLNELSDYIRSFLVGRLHIVGTGVLSKYVATSNLPREEYSDKILLSQLLVSHYITMLLQSLEFAHGDNLLLRCDVIMRNQGFQIERW